MDKEDIVTPIPAQCTMAQYEALDDTEFTQYRDFTISDYPSDGANATQMAFALTCNRLFPEGTIIMFSGDTDDTYTKGHCYQVKVTDGVKSWVDITPVSEQTIPLLVGTEEKPINLATDLEDNKYYLLSGYVYIDEATKSNFQGNRLAIKPSNAGNTATVELSNTAFDTSYGSNVSLTTTSLIYISKETGKVNTEFDQCTMVDGLNGSTKLSKFISFYAPTTSGTAGQILQSNGSRKTPTWTDYPISTITNTTVSNWVEDTTYTDFGYKADITITNLKETDICEVIFSQTDASSGNYAQVNSSSANTLTIYSKVNSEITIPTIMVLKGGN